MGDSVTAMNGTTNATVNIPVGVRPRGIAANPVTNRVYVANIWSNTVSVIDGITNAVIATIPVGELPYSVAVNAATNKVYVANQGETVFEPGIVTIIDGVTHETATITAGIQPAFVAVNTTTNKVYVLGGQANGDITVVDGATGATTHVSIPYGPWGIAALSSIAINETTNRVYVTDNDSTNLLVIDGATNQVTLRPVGTYPVFVSVNPANNRVYVSNSNDAAVTVIDEN